MKTTSLYVQDYFKAYIVAVTNPNTGGFNDRTPPITPDQFVTRLSEEALGPSYVHQPPSSLRQRVVAAAGEVYVGSYTDFVNLPLNGDAPPEVVQWQQDEKDAGNYPAY
jgi:hypothetical protein